jgi:tight adherence protein C
MATAGLFLRGRENGLSARLSRMSTEGMSLEEREMQLPFTERVIIPMLRRLASTILQMTPASQVATMRRFLVMAGQSGSASVIEFIVRRIVIGAAFGLATTFLLSLARWPSAISMVLPVLMAALGYMLPSIWLAGRVRDRQEMIQRTLPDALDLLTVCVEAGAGFEVAVTKVVNKWHGPLAAEFDRLLADLRMGRGRREALRDLGERTGVLDVQAFAGALIQADQLGVGLVTVLRVQSEQMRLRRRLRAEEQAQKAPIKMLFPLIFMIFPALYIVILGPAVFTIMKAFGG